MIPMVVWETMTPAAGSLFIDELVDSTVSIKESAVIPPYFCLVIAFHNCDIHFIVNRRVSVPPVSSSSFFPTIISCHHLPRYLCLTFHKLSKPSPIHANSFFPFCLILSHRFLRCVQARKKVCWLVISVYRIINLVRLNIKYQLK